MHRKANAPQKAHKGGPTLGKDVQGGKGGKRPSF